MFTILGVTIMKKITSIGLIVVLSAITIVAVSFIFGQSFNQTKKSEVVDNSATNMRNFVAKNDLQKYGVEVISSTDSNFNSEFLKYVGGHDDLLPVASSLKPFALFIKNNSSKEIVGISLRWKFTDLEGKSTVIPQSEANPGVLMGIKPIDPNMVGKTSLINRKEMKFFTYFSDIAVQRIMFANLRFKNPSVAYPDPVGSGAGLSYTSNLNSQKERLFTAYVDFSVTVDAVLFNDGTFVGENENFFLDSLRGDIDARREILTYLEQAKSAGKTSGGIIEDILSKTANIPENPTRNRPVSATREQAYELSYKNYLKNLEKEIVLKRSRVSDDYILQQLQIVRAAEFIPLRKIDD
jgi:hypothetical protein